MKVAVCVRSKTSRAQLKSCIESVQGSEIYVEQAEQLSKAIELHSPEVLIFSSKIRNRKHLLDEVRLRKRIIYIVSYVDVYERDLVKQLYMDGVDYVISKDRDFKFECTCILERLSNRVMKERSGNKLCLQFKDIWVDLDKKVLYNSKDVIKLTTSEAQVFRVLYEHRNTVISRSDLTYEALGYRSYGETRAVDVHIRYLRQKIGNQENIIETIRGQGFMLQDTNIK